MATIYYYISIASYIVAILFLVLSIVLFFKYDIRKIVGDLSGRNARKSVEAMKKRTIEKEDTSTSLGSRINSDKTTDKLEDITAKVKKVDDEDATIYLERDEDATVHIERDEDATVHLERDEDATVHLERDEDATMYLDKSEDETVHLEASKVVTTDEAEDRTQMLEAVKITKESGFVVEREITLVHTDKYLL